MNVILNNYFFSLSYQFLTILIPLVTAPYLTRVLGAEGTGIYGYVHSLTSLICSIVMLGVYGYGNRQIAYVRDNPRDLNDIFWRIISARIVIAIFGSIIYFIIIILVGRYRCYFYLYYTYLLGYFIDCTWLFVGVEDMKWAVLKNTLMKLLTVCGIFLFVKNRIDVGTYIFIQGGSILFANLTAYSQLNRYVGKPNIDFSHLREDLFGSLLIFLPGIAQTLYLQCDKIMLELLTNATEQVAQYDYAEKIVTIPLSFITVLSTVMMPRIANEFKKNHVEEIEALLNKAAKFSVFLAFPLMFGMILIAGKMVPWYLGAEFSPTSKAICIISPIIVLNTLIGISGGQYFTATNQINLLLNAQISAAVGNVVINALLIPKYGYVGAAIATVIASTICASVQYYHLIKQIRLPGLFGAGARYCVISAGMYIIVRLLSGDMPPTPLSSVYQIVSGAIFYFVSCLLIKDEQFYSLIRMAKEMMKVWKK